MTREGSGGMVYTHLPRASSTDSDLAPIYSEGTRVSHRKMKNYLAGIFVGVVCFFGVVAGIVAASKYGNFTSRPGIMARIPIVNSSYGVLEGKVEDEVFIFKGIPYAEPPIGQSRWKKAKAIKKKYWDGVKIVHKFGSPCSQIDSDGKTAGSEDCLYLNIWTPSLQPSANLDVMVYFHDGGFVNGSGHDEKTGQPPNVEITKTVQKVFVSFNYRLNAFGFLALDLLSWQSPYGKSGNYGFLDMVLALKWVQSNIKLFGGNPNKVTLYGLGSGGTAVSAMLRSPEAKGLFHRAWIISGSPTLGTRSYEDVEKDNLAFLNNTGCNQESSVATVHCLYNMLPSEILEAVPWNTYPAWAGNGRNDFPLKAEKYGDVLIADGYTIPDADWGSNRVVNDVPLLIGNVNTEIESLPKTRSLYGWPWKAYDKLLERLLEPFGPESKENILKYYPHVVSSEYQYAKMVSDIRAVCPTMEFTKQALRAYRDSQSDIYRYIVTTKPSIPYKTNGQVYRYSYHGYDLDAFMGVNLRPISSPSKEDVDFIKHIREAVLDFVDSGTIPHWKKASEGVMVIGDTLDSRKDYQKDVCQFWKKTFKGITKYAWKN